MAKTTLTAQLASQILDHIRANGLSRGQHLPSQALEDAFRVSRAPVNAAFKFLETMGVVAQQRHRGYFLKKIPAKPEKLGLPETVHSAEERYLLIADDRLAGKLDAASKPA